jgi:tetratricopeptide (TPR) repeat protein
MQSLSFVILLTLGVAQFGAPSVAQDNPTLAIVDSLAIQGQINPALHALARASQTNREHFAETAGRVCFFGVIWGEARTVLPACDAGVRAAPKLVDVRLQRVLARTLGGDREGAITDVDTALALSAKAPDVELRDYLGVILYTLRAGENPFPPRQVADWAINISFPLMMKDVELAHRYNQRAVTIDPENPRALNDLSYTHLLLGNFGEAISLLLQSHVVRPQLSALMNLGDAHRLLAHFDTALYWHHAAERLAVGLALYDTAIVSAEYRYNYMPQHPGDRETIQHSSLIRTATDKLAFIHYGLSLDYALLGNLPEADRAFVKAWDLASGPTQRCYVALLIQALPNFVHVPGRAQAWLDATNARLTDGITKCPPDSSLTGAGQP